MHSFLERFDRLADIETENNLARRFDRTAFALMVLMFVAAPHSIAATNVCWLTGTFVWFVRQLFFKPRRPLVRTPLDLPLWAFFGWSLVSSIFSYDPLTSLDKFRLGATLFLIFYYVVNVARTRRAVVFLAFTIVASTMVSVVWTPIERIIGRGVQIVGTSKESVLTRAALGDGDALLKANGVKIRTPDDLIAEIQKEETTKIYVYRPDYYLTVEVNRADFPPGANALERLGIADWKPSRNWRSAGFYGHYTTFAEVLQLIASLTFGLFIASFSKRFSPHGRDAEPEDKQTTTSDRRRDLILIVCLAGMSFALLLTVTRASQLAFLISAAAIVLLVGSRRMFLVLAAIVLPIALIGLVFLQQSRNVGFFDAKDESTRWRQTVYREGFDLWTENARHLTVGVGMDSIKKYAKEWRLFDDGRLPMGHFHSTPLQIAVERGTPALLIWLWVLWIYGRMLCRKVRSLKVNRKSQDWRETGIILGCFGGLVGFATSGLVHYNLGDSEVAMVFFMLMGLSVRLANAECGMRNAE